MPVKIKFIRAREFMEIRPEGEFDIAAAKQLLLDVAAAVRPPADYELLIDLRRAQWRLTGGQIWELVAELAGHPESFRQRIAILALPGAGFDHAERVEICAQDSGRQVRAFTNFEDALHWIFEGTTS